VIPGKFFWLWAINVMEKFSSSINGIDLAFLSIFISKEYSRKEIQLKYLWRVGT